MSFRIEEKILVNKNQIIDFKDFYMKLGSKKLYETRKIRSLYFENENRNMFKDSIEGVLPRKKIRIRQYPDNKSNEFFIEEKISSVEGRFKKKKKIDKETYIKFKNIGFFDSLYGHCKPILYVEYKRNYIKLDNIRITHDTDIKYNLYLRSEVKFDPNQIFEIKANHKTDLDDLAIKFPMNRTRFSKYCNGIELFFN